MSKKRVLNDEMYAWRADAELRLERDRDGRNPDWSTWGRTFAARTIWLVRELERVLSDKQENKP